MAPPTKYASIFVAASIPLVLLAFWPLYLSRPFAAVDTYTHAHAVGGTVWLLLLLVQPYAIHTRRFALHRALGKISWLAAPGFAAASMLLSHHRLQSMDAAKFATEGFSHYLPVSATAAFLLAYSGGMWFRRIPDAHGRFMLLTAIPLVDPVFGRLMAFYLPPLPSAELYQAAAYSLATAIAGWLVLGYRGKGHAKTALRGYLVVLTLLEIGWFTIAATQFWLEAVRWFRGVPLTG